MRTFRQSWPVAVLFVVSLTVLRGVQSERPDDHASSAGHSAYGLIPLRASSTRYIRHAQLPKIGTVVDAHIEVRAEHLQALWNLRGDDRKAIVDNLNKWSFQSYDVIEWRPDGFRFSDDEVIGITAIDEDGRMVIIEACEVNEESPDSFLGFHTRLIGQDEKARIITLGPHSVRFDRVIIERFDENRGKRYWFFGDFYLGSPEADSGNSKIAQAVFLVEVHLGSNQGAKDR